MITIWWTDGAVMSKWRCMSASAGGLFEDPAVGIDEGQILALKLRKARLRRGLSFAK
ncbi:hypothetical protein [Mesorhizobium sp. M0062]|uniref:hypothetical protein n=1 Tax=Mesorhizobium sp. M0062 TaxID=2956867 RepID=UPI0033374B34